jgi:hypothetical protein
MTILKLSSFIHIVFGYLVTIWPVADVLFRMQENKEGLELLKSAIDKAGYTGKVSFPPCRNFVLVLWLFKCLLLREFDILYTVLLRLSLEWMLQLPSSTRRTNHMIWTSRKTWALFFIVAPIHIIKTFTFMKHNIKRKQSELSIS